MSSSLHFLIIGDAPNIIDIIHTLKDHNQHVYGIMTLNPKLRRLCISSYIKVFDNLRDVEVANADSSYDILLSIGNSVIIPDTVLRLATKYAINCHDSLLPKYKGVHALPWAIRNKEDKLGITWHLISKKIDSGAIILQEELAINKDDSVATVSIPIASLISSSFQKLLNLIETNKVQGIEQENKELGSYYFRDCLPSNLGILDFNKSGFDVLNDFNSCFTGGYTFEFVLPKIIIEDSLYIVEELKLSDSSSQAPIGSFSVKEDELVINTLDQQVIISKLSNFSGKTISIRELNRYYTSDLTGILSQNVLDYSIKLSSSTIKGCNLLLKKYIYSFDNIPKYQVDNLIELNNLVISAEEVAFFFYQKINKKYENHSIDLITEESYQDFVKSRGVLNYRIPIIIEDKVGMYDYQVFSKYFTKDAGNRILAEKEYYKKGAAAPIAIIKTERSNVEITSPVQIYSKNDGLTISLKISEEFLHEHFYNEDCFYKEIDLSPKRKLVNTKKQLSSFVDEIKVAFDQYKGSIALEDEKGDIITYFQLESISNSLKEALQSKYGKQKVVAVFLPKDPTYVIAAVSIIKSGNIYLPLDVNLPLDRLEYILRDSGCSVIITSKNITKNHQIGVIAETLESDFIFYEELQLRNTDSKQTILTKIDSEDIAYVIYTSGSTGVPKGVMITHHNLHNYMSFCKKTYRFKNDKVIFHSSPAFDMSITSFLFPLLIGKKILVVDCVNDMDLFEKSIKSSDVGLLKLTPTHIKLLPNILEENEALIKIECIIVGGEKMLKSDVEILKKYVDYGEIYNEYGPTESTVGCSIYKITGMEADDYPLPIGKAIPNTYLYLVDKNFNLVDYETPGELLIGGEGVAKGYINNQLLTDNKFITNPYNSTNKVYRTGDLVVRKRDSLLYFIGRNDDQVKFKGYRIELSEIEQVCKQIEVLSEATALLIENSGAQYLVLFIVLKKISTDIGIITSILKKQLPAYMVPSRIIPIESLPLKMSGKVDKELLTTIFTEKENGRSINSTLALSIAPGTDTIVSQIWKEVLNVKIVNENDNFLKLGGDSIASVMIASKLRKAGFQVDFNDIFQNPVYKEFLRNVSAKSLIKIPEKVENTKDNSASHFPLTPGQYFFLSLIGSSEEVNNFNMTTVLSLNKVFNDKTEIMKALFITLEQNEIFKISFKKFGGKILQVKNHLLDINKVILTKEIFFDEKIGDENLQKEIFKWQDKINLFDGPRIIVLFLFGKGALDKMVIIMHHFLIDRVSWKILVSQIEESLYSSSRADSYSSLNYMDWCISLTDYANSEKILNHIEYWEHDFLQDLFPKKSENYQLNSVEFKIDFHNSLVSDIKFSLREYLLYAFVKALYSISQTEQITIFLENHGRIEEFGEYKFDLSNALGFFANLYPLIINQEVISRLDDINEGINAIHRLLNSVPNNGFEYLLLNQGNYFTNQPNFEILFNYLGEWNNGAGGIFRFETDTKYKNLSRCKGEYPKLTFNCEIVDGILQGRLIFNEQYLSKQDILQLQTALTGEISYLNQVICNQASTIPSILTQEIPLTFTQKGMLYATLKNGRHTDTYLIQTVIDAKSEAALDISKIERALKNIVNKHCSLRTKILIKEQGVFQSFVTYNDKDFSIQKYDFRALDESSKILNIEKFLSIDRKKGINLNNYPLVRVVIFILTNNHYKILITFHHIIYDGWCNKILLTDLESYYANENNVTVDFRYAIYLEEYYFRNKTDFSFWQNYLQHIETINVPDLYVQNTFNSISKKNGALIKYNQEDYDITGDYRVTSLYLPKDMQRKINDFSVSNNLTFNTILQSSWSLLLFIRSGFMPCIYGVSFLGREADYPGINDIIGLFINTLPFVVNPSLETDLLTYMQSLQQQIFELQARGRDSFIEVLNKETTNRVSDIVKYIYTYQKRMLPPVSQETIFKIENIIEKIEYEVTLSVFHEEEVQLRFSYNSHLINDNQIRKLFNELLIILNFLLAGDYTTISDLEKVVNEINACY